MIPNFWNFKKVLDKWKNLCYSVCRKLYWNNIEGADMTAEWSGPLNERNSYSPRFLQFLKVIKRG